MTDEEYHQYMAETGLAGEAPAPASNQGVKRKVTPDTEVSLSIYCAFR